MGSIFHRPWVFAWLVIEGCGGSDGAGHTADGGILSSDAPASDVTTLAASNPLDASDAGNSPHMDSGGTRNVDSGGMQTVDSGGMQTVDSGGTQTVDSGSTRNDASGGGDGSPACNCTAPATCGGGGTPDACGYSTNFAASPLQMPISEGDIWWNGQQTGKLWSDVFAGLGRAYGAPTNTANGTGQYDDPTAILKGTWNPNQRVTGHAFCSNNVADHIGYPEVELRLRFTISANVAKGYEIMWRCSDSSSVSLASSYLAVAAWLGGAGQFTGLSITLPDSSTTTLLKGGGVEDRDSVSAAIYGSTMTLYRNGQLQGTVTDSRYTSGNPGFGFNYVAADNGSPTSGYNVDFGFTSFSATELLAAP